MTISELIETKLTEILPGKTIKMLSEVDEISFTIRNRLTVNGRKTQFCYNMESYQNAKALHGFTDEDFANDFVKSIELAKQVGVNL